MAGTVALTLYDYLLVFGDEVRRRGPRPFTSVFSQVLPEGSVCLERPQNVGFVPVRCLCGPREEC